MGVSSKIKQVSPGLLQIDDIHLQKTQIHIDYENDIYQQIYLLENSSRYPNIYLLFSLDTY